MARWSTIAALWLCAGAAHADRVHLVDGAVIEGKATREGDRVVIEVDSGNLALPADQVTRIEPAASPVQQVETQRAHLPPRDVARRLELANYCRDHGLTAREEQLLREIIDISPDHAEARTRLGYVRVDGVWMRREQSLRAQGLVQHEGRWLTREQLLELERLRAQAQTAANERDRAQAQLETARTELELRKQEAETAASTAPPAPAAETVASAQPSVLLWSAPYPWLPYHYHHREHACAGERCDRRSARKPRPDGRPHWPIVGTKDPFDYLR